MITTKSVYFQRVRAAVVPAGVEQCAGSRENNVHIWDEGKPGDRLFAVYGVRRSYCTDEEDPKRTID